MIQTEAYSAAVLVAEGEAYDWSPEQTGEAILQRQERTVRLLGNTAVHKSILVREATLGIEVGSPATMEAAVRHVLDMFIHPPENTALYLIPSKIIPGTAHQRAGLGDHIITNSAENGTRVWVADGTTLAPEGSVSARKSPIDHANLTRAAAPRQQAIAILALRAEKWARELD